MCLGANMRMSPQIKVGSSILVVDLSMLAKYQNMCPQYAHMSWYLATESAGQVCCVRPHTRSFEKHYSMLFPQLPAMSKIVGYTELYNFARLVRKEI